MDPAKRRRRAEVEHPHLAHMPDTTPAVSEIVIAFALALCRADGAGIDAITVFGRASGVPRNRTTPARC